MPSIRDHFPFNRLRHVVAISLALIAGGCENQHLQTASCHSAVVDAEDNLLISAGDPVLYQTGDTYALGYLASEAIIETFPVQLEIKPAAANSSHLMLPHTMVQQGCRVFADEAIVTWHTSSDESSVITVSAWEAGELTGNLLSGDAVSPDPAIVEVNFGDAP